MNSTERLDARRGVTGGRLWYVPLLVATSMLASFACSSNPESAQPLTVADPPAEILATQPPPPVAPAEAPAPTPSPLPPTPTASEAYPPLGPRTDWELVNTQGWLNGGPTTIADLRDAGEVVLIDFWAFA